MSMSVVGRWSWGEKIEFFDGVDGCRI